MIALRCITPALLAIAAAGCTRARIEIDRPSEWPEAALREGEMSYGEALDLLGPPEAVGPAGDGFAMLYERVRVNENQLGFSVNQPVLNLFKVAAGGASADRQATLLVFDAAGVLQTKRQTVWRDDLGRGAGVQIIVQAEPVVDSSALTGEDDPTLWGSALLRPLPQALNAQHSLDFGDSGAQLRGAPQYAGQRTLETHDPSERPPRN